MALKVTAYKDKFGNLHPTETMADQGEIFLHLVGEFKGFLDSFPNPDADQIVNKLYDHRESIRSYLNLTEKMMEEAYNK